MPNCPYCSSVLLPHLHSFAHLYYFCQECRVEVPESMVQLQMAQQADRDKTVANSGVGQVSPKTNRPVVKA
jgi:hypothetical protein